MAELAAIKVTVHGRVTGLGFRAFTSTKARTLGLTGYVRNLPEEKGVELEAEGDKPDLEKLIAYLKVGPPLAKVESVDVEWAAHIGKYSAFGIWG